MSPVIVNAQLVPGSVCTSRPRWFVHRGRISDQHGTAKGFPEGTDFPESPWGPLPGEALFSLHLGSQVNLQVLFTSTG